MNAKELGARLVHPLQEPQAIHAHALAAADEALLPNGDTAARDRVYMAARGAAVQGITLRQHYAGQVMAQLSPEAIRLSMREPERTREALESMAAIAVRAADALLAQLAAGT